MADKKQKISIKTPLGEIFATPIPDQEYPGIFLGFSQNSEGGEPGVILEYDPLKNCIQARVYGPNDPDGDPMDIFQMSLDSKPETSATDVNEDS
jgi:hypothetical protein